MKTKELKQYNLPIDRIVTGSIDAKPYFSIFLLIAIGLVQVIGFNRFYGLALVFLGLSTLVFLPRRVLMEFTNSYVILFNKANQANCILIHYEDISSWSYISGFGEDEAVIELVDGSTQRIECYSRRRFESLMNLYAKDKQKNIKRR